MGTARFERTVGAVKALIVTPVGLVTILAGIAGSVLEVQAFLLWTNEFIFLGIIAKVFCAELMPADHFRLAVVVSILVEGVVLDKVA